MFSYFSRVEMRSFQSNRAIKRLYAISSPSDSVKLAKPFDDIPGPKRIPYLGTAWKYFPFIGNYTMNNLFATSETKFKEFGSIVREEVVPGVFVVNVFDPDDIEKVYKAEGKYPSRRSHLAVEHYRLSRPHIYNSGGLLPTNGSEWWRLRSAFQKSLSKIQNVRRVLPTTDAVMQEMLETTIGDGALINDFQVIGARLGLELAWVSTFGSRLAPFQESCDGAISRNVPYEIMTSAEAANGCLLATDNTEPIWKKWKTPKYKEMERHLSNIESVVLKALREKKKQFDDGVTKSNWEPTALLDHYFLIKEVDFKDVTGVTIDIVLGGVDTTSYTSSFLVWHLTQNPNVQDKLREEATRLLVHENSPVTPDVLNEALYTRAVLKETFRLNPIAIGISRNLAEDTVLSGYLVPKNTLVLTQNMVASRQGKYFNNPMSFVPERWMKDSQHFAHVSPYLILPFSHGPRTCIARRLAEQNLLAFFLKIARKYRIEWCGEGEVGIVTPIICKPDRPIKVMFKPWK